MDPKYIVTMNDNVVLFSPTLIHSNVAKSIGKCKSAGFFRIFTNKEGKFEVYCYGESISLGLESSPKKDAELIIRQFNLEND